MKKKLPIITSIALSSMIATSSATVFADIHVANNNLQRVVKMTIDSNDVAIQGESSKVNAVPYGSNGNTMVPLRFIANAFGINDDQIVYDQNSMSTQITYKNSTCTFTYNTNEVIKQNNTTNITEVIKMDNNAVMEITNGSSYIPVRILEKLFNIEVFWDSYSKSVLIIDYNYMPITTTESTTETTTESTTEATTEATTESITSTTEATTESITITTEATTESINTNNQDEFDDIIRDDLDNLDSEDSKDILEDTDLNNNLDINSLQAQNQLESTTNQIVLIQNSSSEKEVYSLEQEVIKLVNEERVKNGLTPLEYSSKLAQTAREKSDDMSSKNYFSHEDPDGNIRALDLNVAENIAAGQTTASGVVNSWLDSEAHRANILDPNTKYIGVGYSEQDNSQYGYYWTQQFSKEDKWSDNVNFDIFGENALFAAGKINVLTEDDILLFEEELLALINEERIYLGLEPLLYSTGLTETAVEKSKDMAINKYIGHVDLNGDILYQEIEEENNTIKENYALATISATEVLDMWLSIDTHKEELLKPENRYIGIGFVQNLNGTWRYYTTAHFSADDKWRDSF